VVICVAFLAHQRGGRSGGLAVCHGRDLLAGALPLQDFTDSGTAGCSGAYPGRSRYSSSRPSMSWARLLRRSERTVQPRWSASAWKARTA
jgi:hypothetical protein